MKIITVIALMASLPAIASEIPSWVMNPTQGLDKNMIAAASCTVTTGDFSMDRTIASTDARSELVKQFEIAVQNEVESVKNSAAEVANKGGNVSRSSTTTVNVSDRTETIAQAVLQNSKVIKAEYVVINEQKNFCSQVAVIKSAVTD